MGPMYRELAKTAFGYPIIDNHAHPFLKSEHRDAIRYEVLISEAHGDALDDAVHTLACLRATAQLSKLLGSDPTWEGVNKKRLELDYAELCKLCMEPTGIQCILFDDGLGGIAEMAEDLNWHDQYTKSPSKRIVRLEVEGQNILQNILIANDNSPLSMGILCDTFLKDFTACMNDAAKDELVVGYKSVACYRTGLDVDPAPCSADELYQCLTAASEEFKEKGSIRFQHKALNDHLVKIVLDIAGKCKKPSLGDNDIALTKSSPAHMQPIIKAFPETIFVLLHSSYPYTRDAGYLTSVYKNVYLDFGEIFPFISADGQRTVIREVLELAPTNKILWSSSILATTQAREAMYEVLADFVGRQDLTEDQAVSIVKMAFFENANRIYMLGLQPNVGILSPQS
ncbi:amidohydrolase 2 [Suillus paluster]|uniref:amidohydrolase 2 n=1 Tax=Suillus paluster TaxID=48578 RepID=UPI001B86F87B|nr:amidohydrolase 2 [Suillus paluster]KAG1728871.1 amidohydrolase 2 [Suillus paluster]